jgi:FkbH-like protein
MAHDSSPAAAPGPANTPIDPAFFAQHNGARYRTPIDLQVNPDPPARFLVVGGCLAQPIPEVAVLINPALKGDFVLLNNFDTFPDLSAAQTAEYDFQIIHIPLRAILGNAYFNLPDDLPRHKAFLVETQDYLARYLENVLRLNREHKLTSFVLGFLVPQQNQLGRFRARYDVRNVMHFIERLNMFMAAQLAKLENAYFVDADAVAASMGKKFCQDDAVWSFTHGTTLSDGDSDHDANRIHPPASMQQYYSARWMEFFEALHHEIFAMHRTLRQQDSVKLVVVDLDDTLWRGVAAEGSLGILEGWPMGFMEALLCLKTRGILLAIVSKNDEQFIVSKWDTIVQGHIALSDFAIRKINFRTKAENLSEILQELNLRPQNTIVIDDNPVERAAIAAGVPGVRILGAHLYYLKRMLLWSPETQQSVTTGESSRRTEMAQAQVERESVRKTLSHEEFLATLQLRVTISAISSTKDLHMLRALELFNKTNQFNTTGVRYSLDKCHQLLASGRQLFIIEAEDRFTKYGLIGTAWVYQHMLEHIVMSCRALGMGIEDAFLAHLASRFTRENRPTMLGQLHPTAANLACRQFYSRNGFTVMPNNAVMWSRSLTPDQPQLKVPPHISLTTPPEAT